MRIAIIGGGVAGCVMARSLSRLPGLEVICLERVAQGDHSFKLSRKDPAAQAAIYAGVQRAIVEFIRASIP